MKLIVGLGNPGRKYEATRHNAGFWWVHGLARRCDAEWRAEAKFHGWVARVPQRDVWLLMPETFMNASGRAVLALASYYKVEPEQILVAHDELDLPPGTVKLKNGGGTAGHNGLTDIAEQLGSKAFWRLRIGIGHPRESGGDVIDYVLRPPRAEEVEPIQAAIDRSLDLWPLIQKDDMEAAMLRLHTKPAAVKEEGENSAPAASAASTQKNPEAE